MQLFRIGEWWCEAAHAGVVLAEKLGELAGEVDLQQATF